jgi:hypothetical protein
MAEVTRQHFDSLALLVRLFDDLSALIKVVAFSSCDLPCGTADAETHFEIAQKKSP